MNMITIKKLCIRSFITGVTLLAAQSFAALITITPASAEVNVGEKVTIDIMVSNLAIEEDLSAFDIDLAYDPSILELSTYELSNNIGLVTTGEVLDLSSLVTPGQLNLSGVSLLDNFNFQESALKLASVTFSGIAIGTSALSLTVNALGDAFGESLSSPLTIQDGSVSSVPEPSTVTLFGMGLLLLAAVSFRKRLC